jgi:subtilisin-like proprotein convertase family protein
MMRKTVLMAAAIGISVAVAGAAQAVPSMISYTGRLDTSAGIPFDGDVEVTAALFGSDSGGTALWSDDLGTVSVTSGTLQLTLEGEGLDAAIASTDALWLEFSVDGATMAPRQRVSSAPYALHAGDAAMLGGMMPAAFVKAADPVESAALPTDGIAQVSNGALNNEFATVTWQWEGSIDVPDYPGSGAQATVDTSETGDSYLTAITVYTEYTLDLNSNVEMVLVPPTGSGVGAMVLIPDMPEKAADSYANAWTVVNTPALADLLGKKVAGTWTLTLTDTTDDGGSGLIVGQLESFEVVYDVVRSDHLEVGGRLDVAGDLNVGGDAVIDGALSSKYIGFAGYCSTSQTTNGDMKLCLDQTLHNTAGGYLDINPDGTVTVLMDGDYDVYSQAWQRNACGAGTAGTVMEWRIYHTPLGGTKTNIAESEMYFETNREAHNHVQDTRWYGAGDIIEFSGDHNCGTATSYAWNGAATLNRVSIRFVGK